MRVIRRVEGSRRWSESWTYFPITSKTLYFILLGLLTDIPCRVYFSSEDLFSESFGNPIFDEQVVINASTSELKKNDYQLSYVPNVYRRLTMPAILCGVVVVATIFGVIANRR